MLPAVFPKKTISDLFSLPVHVAAPWPGYITQEEALSVMWTTEHLVHWLDKEVDRISGGKPIVLVGWSMGGLLALCYALRFPHKVAHLSLWAASACFMENNCHPGQTVVEVNSLYKSIQERDPKVIYRFLKSLVPLAPPNRDAWRSWSAFVDENIPVPNWEALEASLTWLIQTDIRDQLLNIDLPIDIHHGVSDAIIPILAGEYLAKHLSNSQWYSYEKKGHAWWV